MQIAFSFDVMQVQWGAVIKAVQYYMILPAPQ